MLSAKASAVSSSSMNGSLPCTNRGPISKDVDVYELLDNDDTDVLERYVEEEKAQKYAADDFRGDFADDLEHDLQTLREVEGGAGGWRTRQEPQSQGAGLCALAGLECAAL